MRLCKQVASVPRRGGGRRRARAPAGLEPLGNLGYPAPGELDEHHTNWGSGSYELTHLMNRYEGGHWSYCPNAEVYALCPMWQTCDEDPRSTSAAPRIRGCRPIQTS